MTEVWRLLVRSATVNLVKGEDSHNPLSRYYELGLILSAASYNPVLAILAMRGSPEAQRWMMQFTIKLIHRGYTKEWFGVQIAKLIEDPDPVS